MLYEAVSFLPESRFPNFRTLVSPRPEYSGTTVQASSSKKKAFKAYSKMLSKSNINIMRKGAEFFSWDGVHKYKGSKASKVMFALAYINNDGIPELVLKEETSKGYIEGVFTYSKGKVKRLASGGTYYHFAGYYPKTGIFIWLISSEGTPYTDDYYQLSGDNAKSVASYYFSEPGVPRKYMVGQAYTNKANFNSAIKKLTKSKSVKNVIYRSNSKASRNKYLK